VLREQHRLRVFENWKLRRIFGLRGSKLSSEELHDFHSPKILFG
jgi:hypothetical protein